MYHASKVHALLDLHAQSFCLRTCLSVSLPACLSARPCGSGLVAFRLIRLHSAAVNDSLASVLHAALISSPGGEKRIVKSPGNQDFVPAFYAFTYTKFSYTSNHPRGIFFSSL